jgi:hypothetical protein
MMTNIFPQFLKSRRAFVLAIGTLTLSACGAKSMDMNVVVFNYWPQPLADVYVNGQHVGAGFGSYQSGGTGGSISCCHKVAPGTVELKWVLDGGDNDTNVGKTLSATATLSSIKPDAKYLGVYLYPDGTVELDTAKGVPDGKPRN